ncbi:alpha/beta hydrolase [Pinibacter aurantiacus]|uniref:Alpha/beta hydrolase n=1 Tax=Pinibacter aurantiacus TaxID=2851599 RepID=A0A9E2S3K9_9BACT|nr:alpha/beta hydrolase [Pinibacter aurantiacus]MBV4355958.1 alpha/beta hydrolase [Pinibacter aurantiacus]
MTFTTTQEIPVKPSKQIEEVSKWWLKSVAASRESQSLAEVRDINENWQSLTAEPGSVDYIEVDAGGVQAMWAIPKECFGDRVLLCVHGGGFFSGSMYTHRKLYGHFAKDVGCRALIIHYRRSPEHVHPAQVNDVVTAYRWLLGQGIQAGHIAIVGDSAGGGLAVTSTLLIRDKGLPMPAAVMPFSAWFDMEVTGESVESNKGEDLLLNREWLIEMAQMRLGKEGNPKDRYANPFYDDLKGLPPVYLQVGGDELLLDDSITLAKRAKAAGIDVRLDIFPGMQHTFQMAVGRAPEANDAIARYVNWIKPKLGLK